MEPDTSGAPSGPTDHHRAVALGRRGAQALYVLLTGMLIAGLAGQVTYRIFTNPAPATPQSCDEGVAALGLAVSRARKVAAFHTKKAQRDHLGPRRTAERTTAAFRQAIGVHWGQYPHVRDICGPDRADQLDTLHALRYAEEQALTVDLAKLRALRARAASFAPAAAHQ